jgi:hypothetical protein
VNRIGGDALGNRFRLGLGLVGGEHLAVAHQDPPGKVNRWAWVMRISMCSAMPISSSVNPYNNNIGDEIPTISDTVHVAGKGIVSRRSHNSMVRPSRASTVEGKMACASFSTASKKSSSCKAL